MDKKIEIIKYSSNSWLLDFSKEKIEKTIDNLESLKQSIYVRLRTQRYGYLIYSKDFGITLMDLFGKPPIKILSTLEQRIINSLMWDDRIIRVYDFEFEVLGKSEVKVKFTVDTTIGKIENLLVEYEV